MPKVEIHRQERYPDYHICESKDGEYDLTPEFIAEIHRVTRQYDGMQRKLAAIRRGDVEDE